MNYNKGLFDENNTAIMDDTPDVKQELAVSLDQIAEAAEKRGEEDAAGDTPSSQSSPCLSLPEANLDVPLHEWFKLEQKIKVRTETGAEDELYETHVRDFAADRLYLDIPKENGAFIVPIMGSKILANFIAKNNVYFFETFIFSVTRLRGVPVWVLEMPSAFKKIQRRNFLRMDVLLPVNVCVEAKEGFFLPSVKTNCLDISGGGVRYVLDFPLHSGKLAKINVEDFPGVGALEAFCKSVRSVKSSVSEENYWIGAQFVDLPYKIEDKIVRHIFQIQKRIVVSSSAE